MLTKISDDFFLDLERVQAVWVHPSNKMQINIMFKETDLEEALSIYNENGIRDKIISVLTAYACNERNNFGRQSDVE